MDFKVTCGTVLYLNPLSTPSSGMGQLVVVEHGRHQPLLGEGERDAGGIAGDPAPAPLFSNVGGRAGTAGGVEHEIAGVRGHEHAAGNHLRSCLNDIEAFVTEATSLRVRPHVCERAYGIIVNEVFPCESCCRT